MEWLWQAIRRFGSTATLDGRVLGELEILRERRKTERFGTDVRRRRGASVPVRGEHARDTVAGAPR
jgi:hypothetical protein